MWEDTFETLSRVFFYPSLLLVALQTCFTTKRWYDRIDENVILGALPLRRYKEELVEEENVKGVVSMNEDFELKVFSISREEWAECGVEFLQLPSKDGLRAPAQDKLLEGVQFIRKFKGEGSVYVHCKAGRTRSSTLVACYLMDKNGWTPKEAVSFIRNKRPQIVLRASHWKALKSFYKKHVTVLWD